MRKVFISMMTRRAVPDETIEAALCASAYRGVESTSVVPQRNDAWIVAAAGHGYHAEWLDAGMMILRRWRRGAAFEDHDGRW